MSDRGDGKPDDECLVEFFFRNEEAPWDGQIYHGPGNYERCPRCLQVRRLTQVPSGE